MLSVRRACAIVGAAASAACVFRCASRNAFCDGKSPQKWNTNWDFREPSMLNDGDGGKLLRLPRTVRNIYLVRHGQYKDTPDDKDAVLTKLGREQAELTGIRLKELGVEFDAIVNSTMTRAKETADIICEHVSGPREESDLLREGAPCYPDPPYPQWCPSDSEFFQDSAVIEAGFRKFFHRAPVEQTHDTNLLLVCHGNVIRYSVCRALQLQPESWARFTFKHGSITKITIYPEGDVVLSAAGDTGHMQGDKLTA